MKTRSSLVWMFAAGVAAVVMLASCGNSQQKKVVGREVMEQRVPQTTIVESQTVVVELDSIVPDTTRK